MTPLHATLHPALYWWGATPRGAWCTLLHHGARYCTVVHHSKAPCCTTVLHHSAHYHGESQPCSMFQTPQLPACSSIFHPAFWPDPRPWSAPELCLQHTIAQYCRTTKIDAVNQKSTFHRRVLQIQTGAAAKPTFPPFVRLCCIAATRNKSNMMRQNRTFCRSCNQKQKLYMIGS